MADLFHFRPMPRNAPSPLNRREPSERTRQRILAGALRAIARHGLTKLGMNDVSEGAGVSRGTLYRYFPTREALLDDLATHVQERLVADLRDASTVRGGVEERLLTTLRHVTTQVANDPAIRRLIESEPAFVVAYVREHRASIRALVEELLAPLLAGSTRRKGDAALRRDVAEWLSRALLSAVLFPDPDGEALARSLHRFVSGAIAARSR